MNMIVSQPKFIGNFHLTLFHQLKAIITGKGKELVID